MPTAKKDEGDQSMFLPCTKATVDRDQRNKTIDAGCGNDLPLQGFRAQHYLRSPFSALQSFSAHHALFCFHNLTQGFAVISMIYHTKIQTYKSRKL